MEEFIVLDESRFAEMAQLYKDSFAGEPWNDDWNDDWSDPVQLSEYIKEISGGFNALNFGLLMDGKLAAMSLGMIRHWWEGTNYNIEELCVSPGLQGQGLGSRFMYLIENEIRERGLCGIFLQTDNDKPSYRFYLKNGFKDLNSHISLYKSVKA